MRYRMCVLPRVHGTPFNRLRLGCFHLRGPSIESGSVNSRAWKQRHGDLPQLIPVPIGIPLVLPQRIALGRTKRQRGPSMHGNNRLAAFAPICDR